MGSWGSELWDQSDSLFREVARSTKELDTWYGTFFKERSKVEADYAKSLRKLIKNFSPKDKTKSQEDETSQQKGFRLLLAELGYQAGQHELLAETFGPETAASLELHIKQVKGRTKQIRRETEQAEQELRHSYKLLEKARARYGEAHGELEAARGARQQQELSRSELDRNIANTARRTRAVDDAKAQYAHQLLVTNAAQAEHHTSLLPGLLDRLEGVAQDNTRHWVGLVAAATARETALAPIIAGCRQEMQAVVGRVCPEQDTAAVIDRLKTGHLPPPDFQFEDLQSGGGTGGGGDKRGSLVRHARPAQNYWQQARELERRQAAQQAEIARGQKEIKSLQLMVQTYRLNPQYGDCTRFEGELEAVQLRVEHQQAELLGLQSQLAAVRTQLQLLRSGQQGSDSSSVVGGSPVQSSSGSEAELSVGSGGKLTAGGAENTSDFDDDDFDDSSASSRSCGEDRRAVALYPFHSDSPDTLALQPGQHFVILEEDVEGWTKVRRLDNNLAGDKDVGFVPSSFINVFYSEV